MVSMPLVSIITPSYNQAQFLEQTIQSVLNQDYPRIEYIICDGGSTDGSVDIIRRYEEKLSYWVSEKDDGQSHAINKGLQRASGDFIGWINSDDYFLPNCVSSIVSAFAQNPHAGMIYGNIEVINETGQKVSDVPFKPWSFADQLTQNMIIMQPGSFWKRSVMNSIGWLRTDLHYAMDFEYWIRIGRKCDIVGLNQILARFRVSNVNKGSTQSGGWPQEFLKILDDFYEDVSLPYHIVNLKKYAYAGAYLRGAEAFLCACDVTNARLWLLKALSSNKALICSGAFWAALLKAFMGVRLYKYMRLLKYKHFPNKVNLLK